MKTVIMAGGRGTRISSVASDIPKPMIKIEGKPVLERELECLRDQGFTDIILTVSHLGNIIMDYFGDGSGVSPATGKPFGLHIEYYFEKEPLGNAGALFKIKDKLDSDFLLLNADAVFDVDFNRFVAFHKQHGGLVTLFTHPNSHPYDSGLIIADKNGAVEQWLAKEDERPEYYRNRVNAGLHVINPAILDYSGIDAGTGYVGLSIATLLAQHHEVCAIDVIPAKVDLINRRKSPIRDEYIEKYLAEKELKLTATLDPAQAYSGADFVVIAAPTNYDSRTQHFDTSAVEAVIQLVMRYNPNAVMVIKSTIPVGYTVSVREKFGSSNIIFSPEFLRESKALYDNLYPSRIIVGTDLNDPRLVEAAHTFAGLLQE